MLTATTLTVRQNGRSVLRDLAFAVRRGAVTGLIGPNGVGKSTLLRAIAGLLPHDGDLRIDGQPLPADARQRARLIGYLPQGHHLHWPLTVRRTVELGRLPHLGPLGRLGEADRATVDRVMAATGVASLSDRAVPTLSGGERARVMLARVLATDAPLLLADEPTAALDPGHQLRILALLRAEATERARAVLVVLHDLSLAARSCDDLILLLPDGGVIAGPTPSVLTAPALRAAYGVSFAITQLAGTPLVVPLTTVPPTTPLTTAGAPFPHTNAGVLAHAD